MRLTTNSQYAAALREQLEAVLERGDDRPVGFKISPEWHEATVEGPDRVAALRDDVRYYESLPADDVVRLRD